MAHFKLYQAFTWSEESHNEYPENLKLLASEYMQDTRNSPNLLDNTGLEWKFSFIHIGINGAVSQQDFIWVTLFIEYNQHKFTTSI
jgi:hypothetical protein